MTRFFRRDQAAVDVPPSDQRDAQLRRVDWRYLAGASSFGSAISAAGTDLDTAVREICEHVDGLDPAHLEADLAVLSNPSHATLRRAHDLLRPGATCYVEWTHPTLRGIARLQPTLESAGFSNIERYWTWPRFGRGCPHFWLPIDERAPTAHLLRTRPRRRRLPTHVVATLQRQVWRLARRLGLLAPVCVIAWRTANGSPPRSLAQQLRERWSDWSLGPIPSRISCTLLTGGRSRLNKVVVLVFGDDDDAPRLVVKLGRVPESEQSLRREVRTLNAVASRGISEVADVPRILFAERLAGTVAVGETCLGGSLVSDVLTISRHREIAFKVAGVLASFVEGG